MIEWISLEVIQMIKYCMKVAVCDDEPGELKKVASMTREIAAQEGIACELALYESSTALLKAIQGGAQYHALLLDVMMDELSGMELAAALRRQGDGTAIVFISNNREMALQGYEVSAIRYLAKPVEQDKLSEALMVCYRTCQAMKEILLPIGNRQRRISLEDLIYAEAWERGMRLHMTEGHLDVSLKTSGLQALLPDEQFVLCHRAYIVNLAFVHNVKRYELELKNGTSLLISKYRYMDVKEKFFAYLKA